MKLIGDLKMLNVISKTVGPRVGMFGLTLKNYQPEIYLTAGVIAGVGSVVTIAKAHKRSDEVFADVADGIDGVTTYVDETNTATVVITKSEERKMLLPLYIEAARRAVILYGPGVLMGVTSVALIMASHGVLRGRNRALLSTLTLFQQGFAEYRKRVVTELGEEADERFYYGADPRKITTLEIDENGKKKKRRSTKNHIPEEPTPMIYSRVFDETNMNWSPDGDMTEYFLRAVQTQVNDRLILQGYVLLNTVYRALGFQESPEGAVVGWSKNVRGDDFISFGLEKDINQRSGDNRWILDFNVNGVVFETIGES
jgi:hypothetical protein